MPQTVLLNETISSLRLPEGTGERVTNLTVGTVLKPADVYRNALLQGLTCFEKEGFEVQEVPPRVSAKKRSKVKI